MLERPQTGNRAVLVALAVGDTPGIDAQIAEFADLARSAGAEVVGVISGTRRSPDARFFVGSGKADEISRTVAEAGADLVIVNHPLSPSQERNLERHLQCRVLDRSGLILDIFAQRARSHEGKLQVELAQLRHMATRLVRGWTHLERQKGGIGLRGPGETQLETDRRLLAARIRHIERRLERVHRAREQGRQSRRRNEMPTVALVGYTNAGKSTLFNRLTAAGVYAADQLFATLDPTLRRLDLAPHRSVILADTVGFVRDLPHELIAAFKATLTETREAALLLHVIDASDPERDDHTAQVEGVLEEIGAGEVPVWRVFNKIDQLPESGSGRFGESGETFWLSAQTGEGVEALQRRLAERFTESVFDGWISLPAYAGRLRSLLHASRGVEAEASADDGSMRLRVHLPMRLMSGLLRDAGLGSDPEAFRIAVDPEADEGSGGFSGQRAWVDGPHDDSSRTPPARVAVAGESDVEPSSH